MQKQHTSLKIYQRNRFFRALQNFFLYWLKRKVNLEYVGQENIPAGTSYVMVCNHETIVDGMLVQGGLTPEQLTDFHCLAGADLATNYGLIGKIALYMGQAVPIDRHGNPLKGLYKAKDLLESGHKGLLIFPEGTRSFDGRLSPMHGGAALLVRNTGVPLIPVFIDGAYEFFNRYYTKPHFRDAISKKKLHIRVSFGKALDVSKCQRTKEITQLFSQWFDNAFANKVVPRDFSKIPQKSLADKER
ncbi:lysophospholipid acyltransferase family protein [Amygdalobacter nucleatus]|uniref:Acyltransferase n=1 Tax=Amygdalobacter nucleatus TaxID=3029274 RepID=A0A133Y7U5_9FIRM|nr:lysophospholipid acyltransferase family protein [Amygdalobacter nucleatus]KXB39165.1 Acyltransferase [Amygdalobacter nucleatus]MDF0485502.1 lysophospholipid acyltransferase family protein [Amygdalobacter nucleatus]